MHNVVIISKTSTLQSGHKKSKNTTWYTPTNCHDKH